METNKLEKQTKISFSNLPTDFKIRTLLDPEDFSLNVIFDNKLSINMTLEQWQNLVKEVMAAWSKRSD